MENIYYKITILKNGEPLSEIIRQYKQYEPVVTIIDNESTEQIIGDDVEDNIIETESITIKFTNP
jgi:hypothetical protein